MNSIRQTDPRRRSKSLRWSAVFCFILAAVLAFVTYLMTLPEVQQSLADIDAWFGRFEQFVGSLNKPAAFALILLSFALKGFLPVIPFSVLLVASGLVFPMYIAVILNALGFLLFANFKFEWGRRFGGGGAHKLIMKSSGVSEFMAMNGGGNNWMLPLLSFIPFVPLGAVYRTYGTTQMRHRRFSLLALIGYMPRLISWSVVGRNMTNPFTLAFTAPIIVLLMLSGLSLLIVDLVLNLVKKDDKHDVA